MNRRKWLCLDCREDTGKMHEHYMLKDHVWLSVVQGPIGMLCISCIEHRLGRPLTADDFNDSYLNDPRTGPQSMRLRNRLTA